MYVYMYMYMYTHVYIILYAGGRDQDDGRGRRRRGPRRHDLGGRGGREPPARPGGRQVSGGATCLTLLV